MSGDLADAVVARLRVRMTEVYGHRWTSVHGEGATGGSASTWAKGLAGLTPQQIGHGLEACIASADPWPPTLPEFRGKCLGIPSFEAINAEILTSPDLDRSPFARAVWARIDGYAHRHAPAKDAQRMRRDAYELTCEAVMRGEALPGPLAGAITQAKPEPTPTAIPGTREARIERMRSLGIEVSPLVAEGASVEEIAAHHRRTA